MTVSVCGHSLVWGLVFGIIINGYILTCIIAHSAPKEYDSPISRARAQWSNMLKVRGLTGPGSIYPCRLWLVWVLINYLKSTILSFLQHDRNIVIIACWARRNTNQWTEGTPEHALQRSHAQDCGGIVFEGNNNDVHIENEVANMLLDHYRM